MPFDDGSHNSDSQNKQAKHEEEEAGLHHRHQEQNVPGLDANSTMNKKGPSQEEQRPFRQAMSVMAFCLSWYITSGINTIATKRFVNSVHSSPSGLDGAGPSLLLSNLQTMFVVTTLQLGAGAVIASALVLLRSSTANTNARGGGVSEEKHPLAALFSVPLSFSVLVVPFLHAWGSISTNMGFTYGSASIVQIIKLLEPVETLLVGALVAKYLGNPHGIKLGMVLSIMLVIGGAMLALLSKGQETHRLAVMFSLMSGLALSCRNVFKKTLPKHTSSLVNFAVLSSHACIINFLVSVFLVQSPTRWLSIASKAFTVQLMLFHAVYNLSSLTVLEYVTAPTHSLLNVGKRYYNIILSMITFGESPGIKVVVGIFISGIGSVLYTLEKRAKKKSIINVCPPLSPFHPTLKRIVGAAVVCLLYTTISSGRFLTAMYSGSLPMRFQSLLRTTPACQISFRQKDVALGYYDDAMNLGYQLGPGLVKPLLEDFFGGGCSAEGLAQFNFSNKSEVEATANKTVLFVSGSMFHKVKNGDHVWGLGVNPNKKLYFTPSEVTMHSVHGPLTEEFLTNNLGRIGKELHKGHPGILLPRLYPEYKRSIWAENRNKQHANNVSTTTCFVANKNDLNGQNVKLLPKGVMMISCLQQNWRPVVEQIGSCDYVSSSCLHGLVIADALGLPRQWFRFKKKKDPSHTSRIKEEMDYFKYRDYLSSSSIEPVTDVGQILNYSTYEIALTDEKLSSIHDRMIDSFPFHLFQTVP